MFLKHHKIIQYILCIFSATLFSLGLQLKENYSKNYYEGNTVTEEFLTTTVPAEFISTSDFTDVDTTGLGETTTDSTETTDEPTTMSATIYETISTTIHEDDVTASGEKSILIISQLFIFLGISLGIVFILLPCQNVIKNIDLCLIFSYLGINIINILYSKQGAFTISLLIRIIMAVIILYSINSIVSWFKHRCSLDWLMPHRIGNTLVNKTHKKSLYLYTLISWLLITLICCAFFFSKETI